MRLRPQQQAIVDNYTGGYLAIPAVPGAGKTTTLAHLAAKLIEEKRHLPGKILIVTYMTSAVGNFKSRVKELLHEKGLPDKGYEVRTLHSLAMNIITERPERMSLPGEFTVVDEQQQKRLLERIVSRWITNHREEWLNALQPGQRKNEQTLKNWRKKTIDLAGETIAYLKGRGISPNWLLEKTKGNETMLGWIAEIYAGYQQQLVTNGQLDFDDLIANARDLLRSDDELRDILRRRWTYLFEDEAQDSNPAQEEMLYLLAGENGNLVRVGDSNQAILGTFTNSDPSLFRNYCRRKDVRVMPLSVSSRSTQDIIDLANRLMYWSRHEQPHPECREALEEMRIEPASPDDPAPNPVTGGYTIGYKVLPTNENEFNYLADYLKSYTARCPDKTVAVLLPMNSMAEEMIKRLEDKNVPYREITNVPQGRKDSVEKLLKILAYLARPHDNHLFTEALAACLPEIKNASEIIGFLENVRLEDLFFPIEEKYLLENVPGPIRQNELWQQSYTWLNQFKYWLTCLNLPADDLILLIAQRLRLDGEELAIIDRIAMEVRAIQETNPDWRLKEITDELGFRMEAFMSFARTLADRNGFKPAPGHVDILTYHKAKGLEWDTVFLVALTARNFPCRFSDRFMSELWFLQDDTNKNPSAVLKSQIDGLLSGVNGFNPTFEAKKEQIMERQRLLYVAVTRARENLFLSAHEKEIVPWRENPFPAGPAASCEALIDFIKERKATIEAG